ncbi:MAG: YceI family protein [Bryocella sp.]
MKTRFLALAVSTLLASAAFAQTSTWKIDPMHSQSNFEIRHMGVSNVRGSISGISGHIEWNEKDPSKSSVVADLDMNTINTTTAARDADLKSPHFFNVAKYPKMHFQSTRVEGKAGHLKVYGDLTISGVTKPVILNMDGPAAPQKGREGGVISGLEATTTIRRADFNIGPMYAPPSIGDQVKIIIDIEMDKK